MFRNDVRFLLICLMLFLLGGFLRVRSGWMPLPRSAQEATSPVVEEQSDELLAGLRETVLDFYRLVDNGEYADAHSLCFEGKWQKLEGGEHRVVGLTSQEEFSNSLDNELGSNGMGLDIIRIDVMVPTLLPSEQWMPADRPELWTLDFLPNGLRVKNVYEVEVGGDMLNTCSRWNWFDRVLVVHLEGDAGWRLLLPGSPSVSSPHHEAWFMDSNPLEVQLAVDRITGEGR